MEAMEIGPDNLSDFRKQWTGRRILDLIAEVGGNLLVTWPIGVGKSHNLDDLVEAAIESSRYDLVVVLLPTRRVLNERRWIKAPPRNLNIVNLRPRPAQSCGDDVNSQWKVFESRSMGLLGRSILCRPCPSYSRCFWPRQFGRNLQGTQVIFATQSHLERDPSFIFQLRMWTGARTALVILDEVNFIAKSIKKIIKREHIEQLLSILEKIENVD
ncbi:MAG TPA: hypothetical protein PLB95_05635 [Syntrophales bacterium]|nr:hypothetical protein [Syntrophorhabdus sp.]HOH27333.1 hypothetical protein [Syntrophorhabdus sp.]HOQ42944.1 hypothetical protein [Smithellaceae bacterium]HPX81356.1 hypothetical protein [Syntrophales bacterium]